MCLLRKPYLRHLRFLTFSSQRKSPCFRKQSQQLKELQRLLRGDLGWMMDGGRPLMQELYCRMRTELLRPKTVVAYRREPFVYAPGNVRLTFDYDIRSGITNPDMLSGDTLLVPVNPDRVLMEVKYDAFLPDIIRMIIQEGTPRVQAFSKYARCRQYDI